MGAVQYYSAQTTLNYSAPQRLSDSISSGIAVRNFFNFTIPTATLIGGNADVVHLLWVPAGVRLCGGFFTNTAATNAIVATLDRFDPVALTQTTASYFGALTTLAAITSQYFNITPATNFGTVTPAPMLLSMTTGTAVGVAGAVFRGYLDWIT